MIDQGLRRFRRWLVALSLAAGLSLLFGRAAGVTLALPAAMNTTAKPVSLVAAEARPPGPVAGEQEHPASSLVGRPQAPPAHGDALASAVQHISYRLERLDPSRLQKDPAFLQSLQVELASPAMPFVSVAVAQPSGSTKGARAPVPPTLLVAFGPRFPETVGHIIATWDRPGLHLQVVDERLAAPSRVGVAVPMGSPEAVERSSASGAGGVQAGGVTGPEGGGSFRFGLAAVVKMARLLPAAGRPLEMVVVTERYTSNGSAEQGVLLLRRTGGRWHPVWSSEGPGWPGDAQRILVAADGSWLDVTFAQPTGQFPGNGARPILVTADGPVPTLLEQRWERRGDGYEPVATRPLPQPLTVLVEFIRRISLYETVEAASLVRDGDPQLVQAGARWLSQRPLGQGWLVEAAGGSLDRGPLVVIRHDGRRITVSFGRGDAPFPAAGATALVARSPAGGPSVWIEDIFPGVPRPEVEARGAR